MPATQHHPIIMCPGLGSSGAYSFDLSPNGERQGRLPAEQTSACLVLHVWYRPAVTAHVFCLLMRSTQLTRYCKAASVSSAAVAVVPVV